MTRSIRTTLEHSASRQAVVVAVILVSLTAVLFAARPIQQYYRQYSIDRQLGISDLVSAAKELRFRSTEARLTGGFPFRPCKVAQRGTSDAAGSEKWKLYAALISLSAQTHTGTPAALHGEGIAQLTLENWRDACRALEDAAKAETGEASTTTAIAQTHDATLLSDLAAAYFARGTAEDRTEWILTAIDCASRARSLSPDLAAAAFNRALAIELIHLPSQAIEAWNDYLQLDADSGWSSEARAHVAALSRAINEPKASRESTENLATRIEAELLPAWGDAFQRGDAPAADRALGEAAHLSAQLAACCNDDYHVHAVEIVQHAVANDSSLASRLAAAHQAYRDARTLYSQNRTSDAEPLFAASYMAFRAANDIFATKPWKYSAASHLYLGDAQAARIETEAAVDFCKERGCGPAALAHLRWVEGMTAGRSGDPQRSLACYREALDGFEYGKELENAASIRGLLAGELDFLGAGEEAWVPRKIALQMAAQSGTLNRMYIAFTGAADAALRRGHLESARMFEDVIVDTARREKNAVLLSDALLSRSRVWAKTASDAARRDLDEAQTLTTNVSDTQRRARLAANIAAARAEIENGDRANELLTQALQFFASTDDHYHLAELYSRRASNEERGSQAELAEADFMRSIHELESDRSRITDASLRQSFFSGGSKVFDSAVRHLWISGRRDDAFRLAEESRGREMNGGVTLPPVTLRDLPSTMRSADAVVEYALLDDRMIAWVVRPSGSAAIESRASVSKVEGAVAAMREALDRDQGVDGAISRVAAMVYAPVLPLIRDAKRLVIIGNKALRAVPFAALRDVSTGHYAIEDHEIVVAPSAAAYANSLRRDKELSSPGQRPSFLLVSYLPGDPARQLPRLEHGREEMDALRALYPNLQSIDDREATPARFLAAAGAASMVHVIAHGVENGEHPEYSSLVLAPAAEGRDLYASAIAAASFRATRFVFISSCGTARPTTYNDAPLSLPESFVAAGVPVVVASLRPVDDAATAALASSFHRALAASGDAVTALRAAQLECLALRSQCGVSFWSSWVAIGGTA